MYKSYQDMIQFDKFLDRFNYLKLNGRVASETFGSQRYLNQTLYRSAEWKRVRNQVIIRDDGCDLADPTRPIYGKILIHHLNPITEEDILNRNPIIFELDNLICVSPMTHEAIHYGSADLLMKDPIERKPGDTVLW